MTTVIIINDNQAILVMTNVKNSNYKQTTVAKLNVDF